MHTQDTACAPGPGAAAAGMKEGALLTREQEQALGKRIREGDKAAMETMITHNLRLVKSIAKQYIGMGMDYDDLLQEGYIGLIAGTKKYDYTLGNKFSTYATWWIKQSITRALASKARMIRLPVHAGEEMNRIRKTIASLYNDLGRNPSEKEVAQKTGFSQEKVRMLMAYISSDTVSLDYKYGEEDGDGALLINCISDSSHAGPEEETEQKMLKEYIASAMSSLTCREQRVIMHRFGLGGIPRMTLDEIGNAEGVTRERIRQIEKNALKKLGRGKRASKLKDFL